MRLFITEKMSVGHALAHALPGERQKGNNHIRCGDDAVAWASGHLLELFEPRDCDAIYSKWRLDTLPILPEQWRLKEISRTKHLLENIGKLLKQADSVVHAGDTDREGQRVVDEILEHFGWKGPTMRLLINDVNPDAIRKALSEMKDNACYRRAFLAGQARSRADWLAGYNLTRWCTLHAENAGYDLGGAGTGKILSVGRVQTPTLGLVVRRDREIENFVSTPYYVLSATLTPGMTLEPTVPERKITGRWQPRSSENQPEDESSELSGLLASEETRRALCNKIRGRGEITRVDKKVHRKPPPLPYSLPKLQMDASRLYDITDTLTHAQALYERGYISYPRSNCAYIPEGHHAQAASVLNAIRSACPDLRDLFLSAGAGINASRKSPAWNDSEIQEHHAIIPTAKVPPGGALSDIERKIYGLVAKRYALQFLPDHEYEETVVEFTAGGEKFRASGRTVLVPGWTRRDKGDETKSREEGGDGVSVLPAVAAGETGEVEPLIEEKKTAPPKRFTYDTLLGAMNSIYLYVRDPEIRKLLKELDGIGTAATQAGVIEILFERGCIEKRNRQIFSTPRGQALIGLLSAGKSAAFVTPDLTALWEREMTRIEKGELSHETFIAEVGAMIAEIVKEPLSPGKGKAPEIAGLPQKKRCLTEGCGGYLTRKSGTYGPFFFCPACKYIFRERNGEPVRPKAPGETIEADCPLGCGKKARRAEGPYGPFWKCSCSPKVRFKDAGGKPAVPEERVPLTSVRCPIRQCGGMAARYRTKSDGRLFWKCETCKNFFDDVDGKPAVRTGNGDRKK